MGKVPMKKPDEGGNLTAGIQAAEDMVFQDLRTAFRGDRCRHPRFQKSGKNGVHADIRRAVTAGKCCG